MSFRLMGNTHVAMVRWATNLFLRIITVTFFSKSPVSSLPFIPVRVMNLAQFHDTSPCMVDVKRNIVGHELLEGWSTAAVAVVMILMVLLSGVLSGVECSSVHSTEDRICGLTPYLYAGSRVDFGFDEHRHVGNLTASPTTHSIY